MKRLASLFLVLCMACSLMAPVWADVALPAAPLAPAAEPASPAGETAVPDAAAPEAGLSAAPAPEQPAAPAVTGEASADEVLRQAPAAPEAEAPKGAPADNSLATVYVSAGGDDKNAGTQDAPLATLSAAVTAAADNATIYVMSDLTVNAAARYWDKHLTITSLGEGAPFTVTRGTIPAVSDGARGGYNSAMIEVGGTSFTGTSSLVLTNIILDDNFTAAGTHYMDASATSAEEDLNHGKTQNKNGEWIDNDDIVQDSIIATYDGTAKITLGEGAVLQNYGGMSAVCLSGGTLIMESDSVIRDEGKEGEIHRGTMQTGDLGVSGAVWLQSGTLDMKQGAKIEGVLGRAIYADLTSNVTINGEITGCFTNPTVKGNQQQGENGTLIHVRATSKGTLGETGIIDDFATNGAGGNAIYLCQDATFETKKGATISQIQNGNIFRTETGGCTLYLDGCIRDNTVTHILQTGSGKITIGSNAEVTHNQGDYGLFYLNGSNEVLDIYGTISYNYCTQNGGAVALSNNGSNHTATMYPGAEISHNAAQESAGGVLVSCGTFTMKGGTISNNISGVGTTSKANQSGGGVRVRRGGTFIMEGGSITENASCGIGGGIVFEVYREYSGPKIELKGGEIRDNQFNVTATAADPDAIWKYNVTGGASNDLAIANNGGGCAADRYLTISDSVTLGNPDVFVADGPFYLANVARGDKFADLNATAENAVKADAAKYYLTGFKGSFWFQSDKTQVSYGLSGLTGLAEGKNLYAAVAPVDANGTALTGTVTYHPLTVDGGAATLALPAGNGNGYAVVLLQAGKAEYVSLGLMGVTFYMGGSSESGMLGEDIGLPKAHWTLDGQEADLTEQIFQSGQDAQDLTEWNGEGYPYEIRFFHEDTGAELTAETKITNPADWMGGYNVQLTPKDDFGENPVWIKMDGQAKVLLPSDIGTLTIRPTSDPGDKEAMIEAGTLVPVAQEAPGTLEAGQAAVTAPEGTVYYLNGNIQMVASGDNLADTIAPSLLFDDLLEPEGETEDLRKGQMMARIETAHPEEGVTRLYKAFKYLDLVAAGDGNAWITANKDVTVHWAYPIGTGPEDDFVIYHFKDLHREYGIEGDEAVTQAIAQATVEEIEPEADENGLHFTVQPGGFSPFVLAVKEAKQTQEPEDPDEPGHGGGTVIPDTSIELDKETLEMEPGDVEKLYATIRPSNATYKVVFWESSDPEIVAVNQSGVLMALKEGVVTITATSWYGNTDTCEVTVKLPESEPEPEDPLEEIKDFVRRCYLIALDREPEPEGYNDWTRWLADGTVDGKGCVYGFIFSKEMKNKNLSDEDYIETLYWVLLDRPNDAEGKAFWIDYLKQGHSRFEVFLGFADSPEFIRLMEEYGVRYTPEITFPIPLG